MVLGTELSEAKEKIAHVDSSSSDSDEENNTMKRKRSEAVDKPSEELVEKMEEKLEAANVDQKRLFLIIFQRFIMILSEHLVRCDTDGRDFDTDWYRWTIGRLQQVFLLVRSLMKFVLVLNVNDIQFNFSIMNKYRSTAIHLKRYSSHQISIHIFLMYSNSSCHSVLNPGNGFEVHYIYKCN